MQIHRHRGTVDLATSIVGAFVKVSFVLGLEVARLLLFDFGMGFPLRLDRYLSVGDVKGERRLRVVHRLSVELSYKFSSFEFLILFGDVLNLGF